MGRTSSGLDCCALTAISIPSIDCVDDAPEIPLSIGQILNDFQVNVTPGYFGQQGIWESICNRPDLIITDLNTLNGTGEDVLACIKAGEDTRDIPVLVLTGNRDSNIQRKLKMQGASTVLFKPVPIPMSLCEIARHVNLRQKTY